MGRGDWEHAGLGRLLLDSRFTYTGARDAGGGALGIWGRGSQTRLDGREGGLNLNGDVVTAMLGADYARADWLLGVALTRSVGDGGYRGGGHRGAGPDAGAYAPGVDGTVGTSLTAAVPYVSWSPSGRLSLWGATGYGAGEATLAPAGADAVRTDIGWTMAAAGLRGDLFAFAGGAALALVSDALWAGAASDRADGVVATDSAVSRLRLGLEGSRRFELPGGGALTPKLEVGARRDGGAAETGFGVEVGGGVAWTDPRLGLRLDVEGRALISHEDGAMRDRGFSASIAYDPGPDSARGLSLALRQSIGGAPGGGLRALFANGPLAPPLAGHGAEAGRWTMEAGYGLPAFGGRFVGTPHISHGASAHGRDLGVGWRLAPEAVPGAPELSLGALATRREYGREPADHGIAIDIRARW